jgi:recombination protein RecR
MDIIETLTEKFRSFPGIGSRQAHRFVYYLLMRPQSELDELASLIQRLRAHVRTCSACNRFFTPTGDEALCKTCADPNRDAGLLLVVEKDVDLDAIERGNSYSGHYFVLGGSIPVLDEQPQTKIRVTQLITLVQARAQQGDLREVIIALSATPQGDNTAEYVRQQLAPYSDRYNISITVLGRGLSTGSELEYADPDTISSALHNRQ